MLMLENLHLIQNAIIYLLIPLIIYECFIIDLAKHALLVEGLGSASCSLDCWSVRISVTAECLVELF